MTSSACPSRPASPSPPRSAPISTRTSRTYPGRARGRGRSALSRRSRRSSGTQIRRPEEPLLVSVRSGARASMPGMMDTILNLGLNDATVEALRENTGDERFAYDSYRRFIQMYRRRRARASTHAQVRGRSLETATRTARRRRARHRADRRRPQGTGRREYKAVVTEATGKRSRRTRASSSGARSAPSSARGYNERAIAYRRLNDIPAAGHRRQRAGHGLRQHGRDSGTGVAFTRDPSTGEKLFYGEFLMNAQGEDVVAGIRTPAADRRSCRQRQSPRRSTSEFAQIRAERSRSTTATCRTSSSPSRAASSTCCRRATASARLRGRPHRRRDGRREADHRARRRSRASSPTQLDQLLHPAPRPARRKATEGGRDWLARPSPRRRVRARSSSPPTRREECAKRARRSSWSGSRRRPRTSRHAWPPGILTARGGMTSHAAVVARGMGKPCVAAPARSGSITPRQTCPPSGST